MNQPGACSHLSAQMPFPGMSTIAQVFLQSAVTRILLDRSAAVTGPTSHFSCVIWPPYYCRPAGTVRTGHWGFRQCHRNWDGRQSRLPLAGPLHPTSPQCSHPSAVSCHHSPPIGSETHLLLGGRSARPTWARPRSGEGPLLPSHQVTIPRPEVTSVSTTACHWGQGARGGAPWEAQ